MASSSAPPPSAPAPAPLVKQRVLLCSDVVPSHYDLHLDVDLVNTSFSGSVSVTVELARPTSVVELYAQELAIPVDGVSFGGVPASSIEQLPEQDGLTRLHFAQALPAGPGVLRVERFSGRMNDNMEGFYRSQYTHSSGDKRYMGVTQFEATDARRAFPCWDEPALKATFSISLTADADLTIVSNMPEVSRQPQDGASSARVRVNFAKTPVMSTYLLAWIVGEFASVAGKSENSGTAISVFTPHGKAEEGRFALEVACQVLDYFERYYDIPYQLPKLDMAAIPDFSAGAMENWGLVTYRETALLIPANASVASRQRVAYVVAHELAHQWFGNLVTMQWWRELWLNEGFATYAGQAAVAHIFPQWDMWTAFVSDYVAGALRLDGLRSSHPIEVEVYTSSQISEIFDAISYYKGASVIRMLADAIGEEPFRDGLRIYLRRHMFKNAVTTDLWDALSEAAHRDVSALMSTWTLETGYPVLSVRRPAPDRLLISQRRFFADGSSLPADPPVLWKMLLRVATYDGPHQAQLLTVPFDGPEVEVQLSGSPQWLVVNAGQSTFCRVAYSDDLAQPLAAALASGHVAATADRLGIINDAFALSRAGALPTSTTLRLVQAFASETNYQVASVVASGLASIKALWAREPEAPALQRLIAAVFLPALGRLTWDQQPGEEDTAALHRALAIALLVDADEPSVVARALELFAAAGSAPAAVVQGLSPDLRTPIYSAAVKRGGAALYQAVHDIYKTGTSDHTERLKALRSLGVSPDPELLTRTLLLTLDPEEVRTQDAYLLFHVVGGSTQFPRLAFDFLKTHWDAIEHKFKAGLLSRIIASSASGLLGEESALEVEAYFRDHPVPAAERTIAQTCEGIRANTRWLNAHRDDVARFFQEAPSTTSVDIL